MLLLGSLARVDKRTLGVVVKVPTYGSKVPGKVPIRLRIGTPTDRLQDWMGGNVAVIVETSDVWIEAEWVYVRLGGGQGHLRRPGA